MLKDMMDMMGRLLALLFRSTRDLVIYSNGLLYLGAGNETIQIDLPKLEKSSKAEHDT